MKKHNRVAAIVGAYGSGKTSLLESILYTTGAVLSKGGEYELTRFSDNTCNYDFAHKLRESVTINSVVANTTFLGEDWTFIDCPGYQEFMQDTYNVLMIADVAIVVCEPDPEKTIYIHHVMKFLEKHKIPRLIFINKIDMLKASIKDVLNSLQKNSEAYLALREVPIQDEDGEVTGFVDLISERAYRYGNVEYKDNKSLHLDKVPEGVLGKKENARKELVESLSEYNDTLLEMLLEDMKPTRENIYDTLKKAMNNGSVVPVFFGIAENDEGIFRLLKALRHDVSDISDLILRQNIESKDSFLKVFKATYNADIGTIYYARVLNHNLKENKKIGNFYSINGSLINKTENAVKGEVIAISSKIGLKIGAIYDDKGNIANESFITPISVMQAVMISGYNINEEPILLKALELIRICDISTKFDYIKANDTYLLWGQGEQHLNCMISIIKKITGLDLSVFPAKFPAKKTLTKGMNFKAEHTQRNHLGHVECAEFEFVITPAHDLKEVRVEVNANLPKNIKKAINDGFLEFASDIGVIGLDIKVVSASYNETDGTENAFKIASKKAMNTIVEKHSTELDTFFNVKVTLLNESLGQLQKIVADVGGKTLDFVEKEDWNNFEIVHVSLPKSMLYKFANEIRKISSGIAYFKIC